MDRNQLVTYLDTLLDIHAVGDYGPQGLQVEAARDTVTRVALAVDTAPAVIAAAADWGAHMLLVHHGIFWGGPERLVGALGERVRALLHHDIHLYAAHLALDAHPEVGNNAVLAQRLGVPVEAWWYESKGTRLAVVGSLAAPLALEAFIGRITTALAVTPRVLAHGSAAVQRVAVLTGGGAGAVAAARATGADTYVTGETSHAHYWAAADYGMNVIFAGHYATETVGVQALGAHLNRHFGIETRFFDFPTQM